MLQQLLPMAAGIAGADRKTVIKEWAVVPGCGEGGDGWIGRAIAAHEQLKATTGIDLTRVIGGREPEPPPPAAKAPKPPAPKG